MARIKPKLEPAQVNLVARRCGGQLIHNKWQFPTPVHRQRFERLVEAGKTRESLFVRLYSLLTGTMGITAAIAGFAIVAVLLAAWLWGGYQTLMWIGLLPPLGTSHWAVFYLSGALTWCGFNIFAFIHRLGILTIILVGVLLCGYLFLNMNNNMLPSSPQRINTNSRAIDQ
ncbi:MAG: hypothetical protein KGO49_09290 [Gammaproteobacteria bacterium]|nr:hypothetical protein [Gammaproteobacteria bacterium]